ncbi:MAG: hypothetical protein BMS9Abin37_0713 [Acidobacteriota bacterium]|nr:MAG: hypothetical protein BMS9Abin37_0713 [Acidobacteriota bacterium]
MLRWALLMLILAVNTCAPDRSAAPAESQTYEATGTIVGVGGEYVLIDHGDIEGFMDAMTMTFPVTDPLFLEGLEEGTRVTFRVVVDGASYAIDRIEPKDLP